MQEETSSDSLVLFLLLGASNLARGYSMLTQYLSECREKTEFLNALGPGRGFCARGGMFNFTYSPILASRVIESAEKKSKNAFFTAVLITDIGNDLMYEVPAETLIANLDAAIDRMLGWNANIFLTSIHVNLKKDVSPTTFLLLRLLFYPGSKVTFEKADLLVTKVNRYLEEKSRINERVHLITGMETFAGLDKIHFSILKAHSAWSKVANEIFKVINISPQKKLGFSDGIKSVVENLMRLTFSDFFRLKKKGREFF